MIYDIYISNYLNEEDNSTIETERLLYSVPITDSSMSLNDPTIKCEMGKTGSFEFSMQPTHPFYNRLLQMKTVMRVVYDGDNIFRGRVLTIDDNPLKGTRKVHLEGDLAFLMDSYQEGVVDSDRKKTDVYSYLKDVIKAHNDQMDVAGSRYKQFELGIVPGCPNYESLTTAAQRITVGKNKFGSASWRKTQDALSELMKDYGGYFRTRYDASSKKCYIDWLETYFIPNVNNQPIKVTENIIELSVTGEVDNLFTVLIPMGEKDGSKGTKKLYVDDYNEEYHGNNQSITVPQMAAYLRAKGRGGEMSKGYHNPEDYDNAIKNYGIIYKTQDFGDVESKEDLWDKAINWIRDNYNGGISSFSVTALDLHHLNPDNNQKYLVGQQAKLIYPDMSRHTEGYTPTITKTRTLISAQYYLHNPDKNIYTIGIPNSLLNGKNNNYNRRSGKKTEKDADNKKESYGWRQDYIEVDKPLWDYADTFVINESLNSDVYEQMVKEDPLKANGALYASTILVNSIMEANEGTDIWLENITHDKTGADVGSVYMAVQNSSKWRLTAVYSTMIRLKPVDGSTKLPTSGTLMWVSGGKNHNAIEYGQAGKRSDKRVWISQISHDKTASADKGSIYKASNDTQWELGTIYSNKIQLAPLNSSSVLPSSGTLTWVRGGTHHSSITYGKSQKNAVTQTSKIVSMTLDGIQGRIMAGQPINQTLDGDKNLNWDDEFIEKVNEFNKTVVIDAAKGVMSFKELMSNVFTPELPIKPTNTLLDLGLNRKKDGKSGSVRVFGTNKTTDENAPESVSLDGAIGQLGAKLGSFGKDGTGDLSTVLLDGPEAWLKMFNPNKPGSTDPNDVNLEAGGGGGGGGGGGYIAVGKEEDPERPGKKQWTVTLNRPIEYKDKDGKTRTVPAGTVGAKDFYLKEVPSFKTNLAVINTAIIDVAHIGDLDAVNAFIKNLTSDKAVIDQISAKSITGTLIASSQFRGPLTGGPIKYQYYSQGSMRTYGLYYNCVPSSSGGQITLKFYKSDGITQDVNFNIADTQYYKDQVSAAWNNGGNTAHFMVSSTNKLNPGGSVYVYAYYKKKDGTYSRSDFSGDARYNSRVIEANTDSNLTAGNIKSGVKIFGVTGTYSASVADDDIQIDSYTTHSTQPSGTLSNNLKNRIKDAINEKKYFKFRVYVDGTDAEKYYVCDFR